MMKKHLTYIVIACFTLLIGCSEDTIDVVMYGTLKGKVIDKESGEPLDNAKITTNPASTTVFTDSSGNFTIQKVAVDDYSVQAELAGYDSGFEAVSVSENNTSEVSFELSVSNTQNLPPSIPILVTPEDGAEEQPLEVQFIWEASNSEADELSYTLDLRNGSTNEMQVFEVGQDTTFTVSNLQLATKYFWQITVSDNDNDPVVSSISEFKTLTLP